jgi:hypothetical protein
MCCPPEFEINGEKKFIEDTKVPLERVIDGGANQGDWSATLIRARQELKDIVLIEPNEQLSQALPRGCSRYEYPQQMIHLLACTESTSSFVYLTILFLLLSEWVRFF